MFFMLQQCRNCSPFIPEMSVLHGSMNFTVIACKIKELPANLVDLWTNWRCTHRLLKCCKAYDILMAVTCWILQKERNNRTFHSEVQSCMQIARTILLLSLDWTKKSNKKFLTDKFQNLLQNLDIVKNSKIRYASSKHYSIGGEGILVPDLSSRSILRSEHHL